MARMGLGSDWDCVFANDLDEKKCAVYRQNWNDEILKKKDVKDVSAEELPGVADLVWASFPCQDLSLAGSGAGLNGKRSGTFWPFWALMSELRDESRGPTIITLENVCGMLTSHEGEDFAAICAAFREIGYRYGAIVIDAAKFVPQSRPRLFFVAVREDVEIPPTLHRNVPDMTWCPQALRSAFERLTTTDKDKWIWWTISTPRTRNISFSDVIEENPESVSWHSPEETDQLLEMMSEINASKVGNAKNARRRMVGTIYKRTRRDKNGKKVQRAEIRFDDIAGCLRTPAGGSSRQLIMVVDGDSVRSRLISSRETARLMGLPDEYKLPNNYNEAYHLTGDGVVVPVVRHLTTCIFDPIVQAASGYSQRAA